MEQHPWDAVGAGELQVGSVQCSSPVSKRIQPQLGWGGDATGISSNPILLVSPCSPGVW